MATIIRRDGTIEDAGESLSEFQARKQAERIQERGLSSTEQRQAKSGGYTEADVIKYYESKTAEASKERALTEKAIQEQLNPPKPKWSYTVTKASGEQVYRTSGANAQGTYVNDVYAKAKQESVIQKIKSQYKTSEIPRNAKKATTSEGDVFRVTSKSGGKTIVTDYKPGGVKETKVLENVLSSGESVFIPKQEKQKESKPLLPPSVFERIDLTPSGNYKPEPTASTSLINYVEKLKAREERLQALKNKVYDFLKISPNKERAFSINPLKVKQNFLAGVEVVKGVVRAPFEIASIPTFLYGRVNYSARALFDSAGRKTLTQGFKDTPSAVRSVFIEKDMETGKYKITPQNVVNIGLTALAVRSVAKNPSNQGLKVYEKYAKTDIKGTIRGYQGTTIFKSSGKLKGRPYKEVTVFKGKSSTSTIQYQGKTYIVTRNAKGGGTYKIIQTKTKLNLPRFKGKKTVTSQGQKAFLTKEAVVLSKGKFKPGSKPIAFKTNKGVTTQDIQVLTDRGISTQYIKYLEQLKTQAKAQATIKSGSQNLKFDARASVKVKSDLQGVVLNQKVRVNKIDYQSGNINIIDKFNKAKIQFVKNPKKQPDVFINQYIKEGKAITGYQRGYVSQPRSFIKGTQDAFVKGEFTITGGKGFNIFKPISTRIKYADTLNVFKQASKYKAPKVPKVKTTKTQGSKNIFEPQKIDSSKISKSIYESKPAPLSQQITLTESIFQEQQAPIYNIPFKSKAPSLDYNTFNFEILSKPINTLKPAPLFPEVKIKSISEPPKQTPLFKTRPAFKVESIQNIKPVEIFKSKSVIEQIQSQKPVAQIKFGQESAFSLKQQPQSKIAVSQVQEQVNAQVQTQKQVARQESRVQNIFAKAKLNFGLSTPKLAKLTIPKPLVFPDFNKAVKTETGFNVFTRIKGVFKQANIKPLSKQDAINFGTFRVGTTSQATFKIEEAGQQAQDVFNLKGDIQDFYKKDNLFIEKKERRIKSLGELQEITFKGIQANKVKNLWRPRK